MEASRELESFLRNVSVRAFRIARLSLRDDADAGDAVQEAMIKMVNRYAARPAEQWAPLFYAILRNCILDEQRRRRSRGTLLSWFARLTGAGSGEVPASPDLQRAPDPADRAQLEDELTHLERALQRLPARQREAFLLRNLEELDVAQTARAMGCSQGSVKTHYSRAVRALRAWMEES